MRFVMRCLRGNIHPPSSNSSVEEKVSWLVQWQPKACMQMRTLQKTILNQFLESRRKKNKIWLPFFGQTAEFRIFQWKLDKLRCPMKFCFLCGLFLEYHQLLSASSSQVPWCELLIFAAILFPLLCLYIKCFIWHANSLQSPSFLAVR